MNLIYTLSWAEPVFENLKNLKAKKNDLESSEVQNKIGKVTKLTNVINQQIFNSKFQSVTQFSNLYTIPRFQTYFQFIDQLIYNPALSQINIKTCIIKNGKIFNIQNKSKILLVIRYLNHVNSSLSSKAFLSISTNNYVLEFQEKIIYTFTEFNQRIKNKKCKEQLLLKQSKSKKEFMGSHLMNILKILDEIPQHLQNFNKFKNQTKSSKIFKLIKINLNLINIEFQCQTIKDKISSFNKTEQIIEKQFKKIQIYHNIQLFKQNSNNIPLFLNFNTISDQKQKIQKIQLDQEIPNFIKYLTQTKPILFNRNDRTSLYEEILILSPETIGWQLIDKGGYSLIYQGKVNFFYVRDENKNKKYPNIEDQNLQNFLRQSTARGEIGRQQFFHKVLVRKQQQSYRINKINNQKEILKNLSGYSCVQIPKFYFDKRFDNSLFVDLYYLKSLQHFKELTKETFSIFNKLYFLYQIIQGLRFLKNHNIVHLDIKSLNILVGKNLTMRITDFGQSFICQKLKRPSNQLGFTPKYAPLQVFNVNSILSYKSDIFSFGILMYQLIFNNTLMCLSKQKINDYQNIIKNEKFYNYLLVLPQRINEQGYEKIMFILADICMKCLNKDPQHRPQLNRLAIIFRLCILYLDKLCVSE